jgi:hypothetical protein
MVSWEFVLACAVCESRKEKRFCLAVHGRICPICCGTEREVTLDCPSECSYLQQARHHERPRDLSELDPATYFAQVDLSEDVAYRLESLIVGLGYALSEAARRDRSLQDHDMIAILTALAASYETLVNSNLVYEAPTANPVQHAISAELQKMIAEYRELERKQLGYATLGDADVLQVLVFLLRIGLSRTNGRPHSRAFLDFVDQGFPRKDSVIAGPEESGSKLIIP